MLTSVASVIMVNGISIAILLSFFKAFLYSYFISYENIKGNGTGLIALVFSIGSGVISLLLSFFITGGYLIVFWFPWLNVTKFGPDDLWIFIIYFLFFFGIVVFIELLFWKLFFLKRNFHAWHWNVVKVNLIFFLIGTMSMFLFMHLI